MSVELVDRLAYAELRKLAKQHGLKANKKASFLRSKLKEIFKSLSRRVEKDSSVKTLDGGISAATSNNVSHTNSPRDEEISAGTALNTTYELESPTLPVALFTEKDNQAGVEPNGRQCSHEFPPAKRQAVSRVGSGLRVEAHPAKLREKSRPPFASPHYRLQPDVASSPSGLPLSDLSNCVARVNLSRKSLGHSISSASACATSAHSKGSDSRVTLKLGPNIPADSAFARRKAYDLQRKLSRSSSVISSGVHLSRGTSGVSLKRCSHSSSSSKSGTRHEVTLDAGQRAHALVDTHQGLAVRGS
ncbi:unnamed protein product [Calicophoron daubneyi]|uniref:Uncharacterized protein n=1 Tax=Calicophoron daubneyi TaxID=300641 RepID=A0AAV2SZI1_CALDB